MKGSSLVPASHLFVCANRRPENDPLGPGCGDHGEQVYAAMKGAVAARRSFGTTWVTKTACLGLCPKHGATVACYRSSPGDPAGGRLYVDVTIDDVPFFFPPAS